MPPVEFITSFLSALPKCEHHVHIEGCLSPSLQFKLAARNNIVFPSSTEDEREAFSSPEALAQRYERFTSLDDFLYFYGVGISTLLTASDFKDLALEYLRRAYADGVRHAEIFFDPQAHTSRGIPYRTVADALSSACIEFELAHVDMELGHADFTTLLIPCFVRHLPATDAVEHLTLMKDDFLPLPNDNDNDSETSTKKRPLLAGIGLDSTEKGNPPSGWKQVYDTASQLGIRRTAHAGEEGSADSIREALRELSITRIDHGVAMHTDPSLMHDVAASKTLVTVCPVSNIKLRVFPSLDKVPIRTFLEHDVPFSINSDDPAYFGAWTLECYLAVQETFNLRMRDWQRIVTSSIEGSWCEPERKAELKRKFDRLVLEYIGRSKLLVMGIGEYGRKYGIAYGQEGYEEQEDVKLAIRNFFGDSIYSTQNH